MNQMNSFVILDFVKPTADQIRKACMIDTYDLPLIIAALTSPKKVIREAAKQLVREMKAKGKEL